jgi:hypothetical protein
MANRNRKITIAHRNRTELSIIALKNHSEEENGFQILSIISQLHSKIFIAVWVNSHVSITIQKTYKNLND